MSETTAESGEELYETTLSRRRFMQASAATAAVVATGAGTAAAQSGVTPASLNYSSDYVQNPRINGSVTVDLHESGFSELDYTADDGSVTSLEESGIVLAESRDENTPHNPVTLSASAFRTTETDENGNTQVSRFGEYANFPRGVTYDDDSNSDTAEVTVSALDATHWTVDNSGSTGTLSVTDASTGALKFDISSQSSGDVATATFDLSSVGSEDATITSGVARKFLQTVADVSTLPSGVTVEFAIVDSTGGEVVATMDPDGDSSTTSVMTTTTGDAQVSQIRVGELGTIEDIEQLVVRIKDAAATFALHGINVEREQKWTYGTRETTDSDGNVTTEEIEEPSGDYSVTSLSTLSGPFTEAGIVDVTYDVEQRASELPAEQVHVRQKDTPETYSQPIELEAVHEFEAPVAYALTDVTFEDTVDEVEMAQSRYLGVQVATGVSDVEDWEDVEDSITWTSRSSRYSSVGDTVTLFSSVSSSDRTVTRFRIALTESEFDTATSGGSGAAAAAAAAGGGSGSFDWLPTLSFGVLGGLVFWFRKSILGALGR